MIAIRADRMNTPRSPPCRSCHADTASITVTGVLMPMLRSEPAVMNLTMLPGAVSHPDGDAVHFDVLHGSANEVIGRLRDLGLDQRGSIVLENVDTSRLRRFLTRWRSG